MHVRHFHDNLTSMLQLMNEPCRSPKKIGKCAVATITLGRELPLACSTNRYSDQPESYCTNTKKEQLLLSYADNFTRQFKKLYGDRKPQFLRPLNECGVEVEEVLYLPYVW